MPDFRLPPLNAGERLYRALLAFYPPRFRRAFGQDLLETFRDQRREAARSGIPANTFWFETLRDVATNAVAAWASALWHAGRRNELPGEESTMSAIPYAMRLGELRFAVRRLLRVPSFSVATVIVLALGIGATTAAFSIVNGVLLEPLPYPRSDRLVSLRHSLQVSGVKEADVSDAIVMLYQEHSRAFDGIAATRNSSVNLAPIATADRAERVSIAEATANLLDVLRVRPALGRGFRAGEDRPGAAPVVILSYELWRERFGAAPAAIGKRIVMNGVSREIVGVMPRGFGYPVPSTKMWIPMSWDPAHSQAGSFNFVGIGRLRDGVSTEAAQADLARVLPALFDEFPSNIPPGMWAQAHVAPVVRPLRDFLVGDVSRLLWILFASVALVLVIACANVANLFLVRGESRQLELAVRGALGSGLAGILAQALSESAVLAALGGVLGVALAAVSVRLAASVGGALGLPRLDEVTIDARVLVFALGVSAFCALFVSLIPMFRARRVPIALVLRAGGRGSTAGGPRQRARSALVVAQTALALVLVAASGLLARSFMQLRHVKPGFDARNVVMARVALPDASYHANASRVQFYDALLAKVRAIPGVQDATVTDWVPLSDDHNDTVLEVEDHPLPPNAVPNDHFVSQVDPSYFRTMDIPLLTGRTFELHAAAHAAPEAIVSKAFAERYWKNESPLGKRIRPSLGGTWYTIVGEVGDAHYDALDKPANDIAYFPLVVADFGDTTSSYVPSYVAVVVRTTLPAGSAQSSIREAVHSLDASLPTFDERSVSDLVSSASARAREMLVLLALASGIALVLGAVGIYGVMAYGVSLRQQEIGVRLALGAQPADVRSMISRSGVGLAAIGVAIGMIVTLGVTRFLQSLLYGVSPTDPLILGGTCAVLLIVAFAASWIPARRAASVDPSEALRSA